MLTEELDSLLEEANTALRSQPESSWTIARLRLALPNPRQELGLVAIDTVTAAGSCNAKGKATRINRELQRIEIETEFSDFDLRGVSHLIGKFQILLQADQFAKGVFRQRFAGKLFPLLGEWSVPFKIVTELGVRIPRPTESPVLLRSAEPGEFAIPPIGSWFEKWDPINLVHADFPDGPTVAIVEHAMHVMLNIGDKPSIPEFYHQK